jgi:hypothetical protein
LSSSMCCLCIFAHFRVVAALTTMFWGEGGGS